MDVYILIKNVGDYDDKRSIPIKVFENEDDAKNECNYMNAQVRTCIELTEQYKTRFAEWRKNNPPPLNNEKFKAYTKEYGKMMSELVSSIGVDVLWKELDTNEWESATIKYVVRSIPFVHEAG